MLQLQSWGGFGDNWGTDREVEAMNTNVKMSRLQLGLDLDAAGKHVGDLMLRWSDNSNPLGYHPIPVISIKGQEGPTVLITGGNHGDEFEGPSAIMRLAQSLKSEMLKGQVILMPALNAPALQASSRVSPLDGANLNRAFPGDPDGGPTAMIANYVETVLLPRCDAAVDLHSGGKASFFTPLVLATQTVDLELRQKNLDLARAFGLPIIWELGANNDNRSLNSAAERASVPMIATELGGGGGVDPEITDKTESGLLRVLAYLDVLPETVTLPEPRHVETSSPMHSLYSSGEGVFDRAVSAGQDVTEGQVAGQFHYVLNQNAHLSKSVSPRPVSFWHTLVEDGSAEGSCFSWWCKK